MKLAKGGRKKENIKDGKSKIMLTKISGGKKRL
jgi:hypothetical protein